MWSKSESFSFACVPSYAARPRLMKAVVCPARVGENEFEYAMKSISKATVHAVPSLPLTGRPHVIHALPVTCYGTALQGGCNTEAGTSSGLGEHGDQGRPKATAAVQERHSERGHAPVTSRAAKVPRFPEAEGNAEEPWSDTT